MPPPPITHASADPSPRIAAIVPGDDDQVDCLLAGFAAELIRQGFAVHGLVQETLCAGRDCDIALRDVRSATLHPVMQDLGSGSAACRLDLAALLEAGRVYQQLRPDNTDLVIFNRFGKLEAEGAGFHAELLAAMAEGMPVLIVVPARHLERWREFTGGLAAELPARHAALAAWFAASRSSPKGAMPLCPASA